MVPEAKGLMVRCWDHNADNRPSFHDCSECTSVMYETYQMEAVSAVRSVEDRLINMGSSDQQADSSDYVSGGTEEFLKALENGGVSQDSQHSDSKTSGEDTKAFWNVEDTNKNKENICSSTGGTMDKLVEVLKESGDYKKIMDKLNDEGVLSEEDQRNLNSSQNLKDFGNAAKVFGEKLKDKPVKILPILKSLFDL
ncbi:unnamed protein product [Staurois parvus]|uniref:Uncharacterized protein n=1 Tax=Staurois parvus TaxID=386267 RepID=A0ABN9DHC3_9NEOB|nr:unnamed protein product [Staurois parvus]